MVPPGALVLRLPVPEDMFPGGEGVAVSCLTAVLAEESRSCDCCRDEGNNRGSGKDETPGREVGSWLYLGKNVVQPSMGRQTKAQRVQRQHVAVTEVAAALPLLVMLPRVGAGARFATFGQAAETWHS